MLIAADSRHAAPACSRYVNVLNMNQRSPTTAGPIRLSTSEFHERVHALSPRIAVFDCDGTLWSGDAGSAFMRWSIDTKLISDEKIAWLNRRYDGYKNGTVSEYDICGEMVQVYAGLPVEVLRRAAAEFFQSCVEPNIFPELAQLIARLQRDGCDIWAVSSTNTWVIEEGVRRFHIPAHRVLAARVQVSDGMITDRLIHVPTDEDKVEALRRVGIAKESNPPDCVFGNSIHDAAMLAIAGTSGSSGAATAGAYPVNPSPGLLERSAAEGWPVFYPPSVSRNADSAAGL
jgi:phosphoserine phosphatase